MKTTFTLTFAFCLLIISSCYADAIFDGDVTLTTQAEVNAFDFTEVTGTLTISGSDITDLSSLIGLTKVNKLIIRGNAMLTNVAGLALLSQAGSGSAFDAAVDVSDNPALTNLDGLSGLTNVRGAIIISNNAKLVSINGFSSLIGIREGLRISNNPQLTSLEGFRNVTSISTFSFAALIIDNNASLTNLDGLSSFATINGKPCTVSVVNNASLVDIDGLSSLRTFQGFGSSLTISDNAALQNVDGLSSLRNFSTGATLQSIAIKNNPSLQNLNGLSNLRAPFLGQTIMNGLTLDITNNTSLSQCSGLVPLLISLGGEAVEGYLASGLFKVGQNGAGCTIQDIIAMTPPAISGFTQLVKNINDQSAIFGTTLELDVANPSFAQMALRVYAFPKNVGSVSFKLNNNVAFIDNAYPYQFDLSGLTIGTHTVIADVYSLPNGQGVKGTSKALTITVVNSARIISFDVVDLAGNDLMPLIQGAKINNKDPRFKSYSIRANATPYGNVSVKFWLNNQFFRVEEVAPYAFNGDNNGTYNAWVVNPWTYTIKATPYVKINGKEIPGQSLEVTFRVVSENPNLSIAVFELVSTTGNYIRTINEGETINVDDPILRQMTITAKPVGQVQSVKFELNNKFYRTESVAPYTMTGDQNGYFNPWYPSPGTYKLTAIPYTKPNATGEGGIPLTITFNVVNVPNPSAARIGAAGQTTLSQSSDVSIYPVPVAGELFVKIDDKAGADPLITIINGQGISLYQGVYSKTASINTDNLTPGVYYLKVAGSRGFQKVVKFVKK